MIELPPRTKGPEAFRTIGEAAAEVGVAPHVLRFWESRFSALRPMKRNGSRRYYRPRDIELLHRIRRLLHEEGYTVKGAVKALRSGVALPGDDPAEPRHDGGPAAPGSDRPRSIAPPSPATGAAPAVGLRQVQQTLEAIAAECAAVAAGNTPPLASD